MMGHGKYAIICDLDGTLALMHGRGPFAWDRVSEDTPNPAVVDLLRCYSENRQDVDILIVTGRSDVCWNETMMWLREHDIPYDGVFMRKDGDYRKDALVKQGIYEQRISGHYEVLFCLDDRNQSVAFWRSLGLTCFQVAPGDF